MHRIGVVFVWVGIISSAIGLVLGFADLSGGDGDKIGFWLNLVPVGFVFLLMGTAMTQLSKKKD